MKKSISVLLALLMVLSMAACVKVTAVDKPVVAAEPKEAAAADTAVKEAAVQNAAAVTTSAPTVAPTEEPTPEPTPVPTEEPTPEPAAVPFEAAIADAEEKFQQVKSMHIDMEMNMGLTITIAMGEMNQSMPMDIHMLYVADAIITDPYVAKMDMNLSAVGEEMQATIYVTRDGENIVLYTSDDGGLTWQKNTNPEAGQLPQAPAETLNLFAGTNADFQLTGTEEVNGKVASVYTGAIDGKYLQEILNSTGAAGELTEAVGTDISEEVLTNLSDILVTVKIDQESGLPVQCTIDMADAMKELMHAALLASMGGELPAGVELDLDMSAMVIDMVFSNYDAVEPIEIPEAALNAPEL